MFRIAYSGPTAEQRRRAGSYQRKNLRIAIRQLERAELYLNAVDALSPRNDRRHDTPQHTRVRIGLGGT